MPLFKITRTTLSTVDQTNFHFEKELQKLIENNLEAVFGCRFVATEFPTGEQHAGRIDTLALSEDDNPVIIEYKKVESSALINQSLFYLAWLQDHQGDFAMAVQEELGKEAKVDWSDIRVICLAPNYKKHDLHAVQVMGANLELWAYRLFKNNSLYLEKIFPKATTTSQPHSSGGLTAGQKAALTRKTASYTVEQHFANKPDLVTRGAKSIQEFILGLDPSIEEVPKKKYIAYKTSQNFIYMKIQKSRVVLTVKLDLQEVDVPHELHAKDSTRSDQSGTRYLCLYVKTESAMQSVKPLLELAYQKIGG